MATKGTLIHSIYKSLVALGEIPQKRYDGVSVYTFNVRFSKTQLARKYFLSVNESGMPLHIRRAFHNGKIGQEEILRVAKIMAQNSKAKEKLKEDVYESNTESKQVDMDDKGNG